MACLVESNAVVVGMFNDLKFVVRNDEAKKNSRRALIPRKLEFSLKSVNRYSREDVCRVISDRNSQIFFTVDLSAVFAASC